MINKFPVIKGALTVLTCLVCLAGFSQTPMPSYYYANKAPGSIKGAKIEVSPFSKPLLGIQESYKASFLDVTLGYSIQLIPGYYKAPFAPEFTFFGSFASYKPKDDSLIFPVRRNGELIDYGQLVLSNLTMFHGGVQVIFWNNTKEKLQIGPGIGVSVGKYKYDYTAKARPDSTLISGTIDKEFVMFSPSLGAKYWLKDNMGFTFNIVYNMIFETRKKGPELDYVNTDLSKAYATIAPKIGFFYTFKKR